MKKYNAHIKCHSSIKSIYFINTISIVCQNALVIILLLSKRNKDNGFNCKIFVTGMTEDYATVITPGSVLAAVPGGSGLDGADTEPSLTCSVGLK